MWCSARAYRWWVNNATQWAVIALIIAVPVLVGSVMWYALHGQLHATGNSALHMRLPYPVRGAAVRLQVDHDRITVIRVRDRSWWELWRRKRVTRVVGWVAHRVHAGDNVELKCFPVDNRIVYTVHVNSQPVLRVR